MLRPDRALKRAARSLALLPKIPDLVDLYEHETVPCLPERGELIMVCGRPNCGKSTFALWWVAQMNLPTLYLSLDTSARQMTTKLASLMMQRSYRDVEGLLDFCPEVVYGELEATKIRFSFRANSWDGIRNEIEAWVELYNQYPEVIVVDNLMDIGDAHSAHEYQQEAMQALRNLCDETGSTVIVLHHATYGTRESREAYPWKPPGVMDINNKLDKKPGLILGVALNEQDEELNIATIKSRTGRRSADGQTYVRLKAIPSESRFERL